MICMVKNKLFDIELFTFLKNIKILEMTLIKNSLIKNSLIKNSLIKNPLILKIH